MSNTPEMVGKLYQSMLKIHLTEKKIAEIYPTDKIQSPIHLCVGQEAIATGVCEALLKSDHIYGTYRNHGIYIAKGGDLKKLFAELYGKEAGCCAGKGGSMHLVAPEAGLMGCSAIVGSTIPVATGDAYASKLQGRQRVVAAFFGDGAIDEGVFFESINFAALKKLPIIYVIENNHYAIHSKIQDRHAQKDLYRLGEGVGIKGERIEGSDVENIFSKMKSTVEAIRAGAGPFLFEFMTYRWHEHVGPGLDHKETYRDSARLKEASEKMPIEMTREQLLKKYKVSESTIKSWESNIRQEIEEAVAFAEQAPFPKPESVYDDVYSENSR
jgi:TPP-dependent pyruvate/acetoin dehydrogenase alpha subunit